MFCKRCGKEIPNNSNVCQHCGSQVTPRTSVNTYTNFNNPTMNNSYQAPPAPQKKQKKTPWKIIAPIVAVLLIVAIVFGIFACTNSKKKEVEDKLRQILEESTTKPVVEFMCEDYDGDGRYEAYAVVGDSEEKAEYVEYYDADICFVNETEAEVIKESVRGHANGTIEVGNTIYVSLEVYDDGVETGKSFIYTSEENASVEADISGQYANVHEEDGKILATDEDGNEIEVELTDRNEENSDAPKTDYNKLYEEYIQNTLIPQYGKWKNLSEQLPENIAESDVIANSSLASAIYSTYINDLNSDSIPEMITVRIDKQENIGKVIIELYKIENNQVISKGKITSSEKYDNFAEKIAIYAVENNGRNYLCVGTNDCVVSTSSGQSYALEVFTFDQNESFTTEHTHFWRFGKGGVLTHKIDGEEFIFRGASGQPSPDDERNSARVDELSDKIYSDLGFDAYLSSVEDTSGFSYQEFPEKAKHIKIFSGGTVQKEVGTTSNPYFPDIPITEYATFCNVQDHTGFLD